MITFLILTRNHMRINNQFVKACLSFGLISFLIFGGSAGCTSQVGTPSIPALPEARNQTSATPIPSSRPQPSPTPEIAYLPMKTPLPDVGLEMLGQINRDRALTDLRKLSGEEAICEDGGCYTITNRQTGSEGLQWAKKYVIRELTKAGYSVQVEEWSHGKYTDQNLIARKPGSVRPEEEVYFVAHLDGVKGIGGQPYPAADDDASGVVDLLELSRVMSSQSFSRTAVLFFSTGEEQDSLGVQSYLNQLSPEGLNAIKDVVVIDMIGYDADQDGVMQLFHRNQPASMELSATMQATILENGIPLAPMVIKGCP